MRLELDRVSIAYNGTRVVSDISLDVAQGMIACLLGPSGCGKTTLLRAIGGFEAVTTGEIRLNGRCVSRPGASEMPEKRRVGMVFQDLALFPHLSVRDNIGFGLQVLPTKSRRARIDEMLEAVGLSEMASRFVHELSGGQQQRVALARALAPKPNVLLLDEPFSNLDSDLREQLAREVRSILKTEGMTAVLVTHDQHEAFAMAEQIGLMHAGRIEQWDTPYRLYHEPATRFAADFIGLGVWLPGRMTDDRTVTTELGSFSRQNAGIRIDGREVEVLIRPDDIEHDDASPLLGEVIEAQFRGAEYLYRLRLPSGQPLLCYASSHHQHPPGTRIGIRPAIQHLVAFPQSSG